MLACIYTCTNIIIPHKKMKQKSYSKNKSASVLWTGWSEDAVLNFFLEKQYSVLRLMAEICWIQSFYWASKVFFVSLYYFLIFLIVSMCGGRQVAVLTSVALQEKNNRLKENTTHTTPLPIIMLAVCIMA